MSSFNMGQTKYIKKNRLFCVGSCCGIRTREKDLTDRHDWCMLIISMLGRQRQEDREFDCSLTYIVRLFLQKGKEEKEEEEGGVGGGIRWGEES